MTDVEIFGPYNIRALQDGRLVRNWSPIITADIIYLDEVFNAPPFLLNALNSMLNERVIFDPFTGEVMPVRHLPFTALATTYHSRRS
ncbi:AAA family ATPase [Vulcanisaeta sp. JCM 16161]|uniref:AAA family ATPase n=1 Tax=Vulcanisaeta sp. JCM 16161 TaxID=1295372 RepID=UPI0006D12AEB|nr:AAA family ATPase [Vulcanisaeta sp. JCM 16161]